MLSDFIDEFDREMHIMNRGERGSKDFFSFKKMMEISPGVVGTGITGALFIDGGKSSSVLRDR